LIKLIALFLPLSINLYGALFLFATANKKYKNRFFLGLFLLNSFLLFVGHFLSFYEYWHVFRYFDFLFLATLLAFYPLYYLYILSAFNFNIVPIKRIYHFIPTIIIAFIMLITTVLSSWENYEIYMNNNLYGTELTTTSSKILAYLYKGSRAFHLVQIVAYNFLTIRFILRAQKEMSNSFSNLDKYQLRYFYIVNISFILFMSIPGFFVTVVGRAPLNTNEILLLLSCILFTLLYLIIALVGIRQVPVEINLQPESTQTDEKIHLHDLKQLEQDLQNYFNQNKPWLTQNLNIWEVAQHLGTNRSYVSNVINEKFGCNFNQFVNSYRINEAKHILNNNNQKTIAEISELAGFGSVNSFIRIFKKIEKCTPSEFRKKNS
jgi:AraC-like DNA-binding protein